MPVHSAQGPDQLRSLLTRLADYRLVLIDTAGLGQQDQRLLQQFSELAEASPLIRRLLVLPATAQAEDLDQVVKRFRPIEPEALIISKTDETSRMGASIAAAIRHRLPVAYFTDGQKVPEDLHLAEPQRLMLRAISQMRQQRRASTTAAGAAPQASVPPMHAA